MKEKKKANSPSLGLAFSITFFQIIILIYKCDKHSWKTKTKIKLVDPSNINKQNVRVEWKQFMVLFSFVEWIVMYRYSKEGDREGRKR